MGREQGGESFDWGTGGRFPIDASVLDALPMDSAVRISRSASTNGGAREDPPLWRPAGLVGRRRPNDHEAPGIDARHTLLKRDEDLLGERGIR